MTIKSWLKLSLITSGLISSSLAHATIPRDAVSGIVARIYGIYTSTDPTCESGLVQTIPLTTTPRIFNMANAPTIGSGPVANPIKCVVLIMQNQVEMNWLSGTYAGTTSGNPDSNCNSGGSQTRTLCGNAGGTVSVSWPTGILADLTRVGLTATTTCPTTPTGSEVIVIYISTNSKCTFNTAVDAAASGCVSGGNPAGNAFATPTTADSTNGIKLNNPPTSATYRFIINPDGTVGGTSATTCGNVGPPRFGFAEVVE
jgi:hypothetical protein